MPVVSGASRLVPPRSEFAMRFCECSCIEFPGSLPHLLRRTIAYPALEKSKEHPMETPKYKNALIVGAGAGLSASLARLLAREGIKVALAARSIEKLGALCSETGAGDLRQCLRWLSGGPASRQADVAEQARRHPVHGSVGQRQGLRAIRAVCDGQVRA